MTRNTALDDALKKARDQVVAYLHEQKIGKEWSPKVIFIRDRMLADLKTDEVVGKDPKSELHVFLIGDRFRAVEETRAVGEQGKETRRVWLKVAINSDNWKQIQKENQLVIDQKRLRITRARMEFLVKLLACVVALLATVCGYIRLDEWSKGYYTKWLRLAALGCIGAVAAVLWLVVAK